MKKLLLEIFLALILISPSLPVYAADIQIKVDGVVVTSDVEPEIISNRTMVPLRVIIENLGTNVNWSDSIVILTQNDIEVMLNLRNDTVMKNGKAVHLDAKPYIKNDRTMVPIRFFAETFGSQVNYKNGVVTVDTEPLVINDRQVKALQQETQMTMGSIVNHVKVNSYIKDIYNIYIENKGDTVAAPANYSTHYDMSSLGNYFQVKQHNFLDQYGSSILHFEIYTLVDTFPDELLEGYPEILLYDATENQWYLFNADAKQSIEKLLENASNYELIEVISNTVV